jgi:putative transposase
MPRRARQESPIRIYHVTSRGNGGLTLFVDDADRRGFLAYLDRVSDSEGWRVYAFCLMGTHFHLVLRADLEELSHGMQRIKGRYGQYVNERRGRWGHVFEARFPSKPIVSERHAVVACAYVAVNPVEAGLCSIASAWPWSSHRAIVSQADAWPFLAPLEELGTTPAA